MTEDELDVGRRNRRGRAGLVAVVVLLALALGWVAWHGGLDQPARPRRAAPASLPAARARPPQVPYLRSGTLVEPDGSVRGIPDGSWTDLEQLPDGSVALAEQGSVTLAGPGRRRTYRSHAGASTLVHSIDRTAVAWRGADGVVMVTGPAGPTSTRATIDRPGCRGLRSDHRIERLWRRCDQDGHLLSPDGRRVALPGAGALTLAPPDDITAGTTWQLPGAVVDSTWEDGDHLLVVVSTGDHTLLQRISTDTAPVTLLETTGYDPRQPVLVLP